MKKIDLTKNISFRHASLRFFCEGEYHCTRLSKDNVLIMVYEGTLRVNEDGVDYEIGPGEYHIQKQGGYQVGKYPSDSPKYMYVHFFAEWTDDNEGIPADGTFDVETMYPLMAELDKLRYTRAPYILQMSKFYEILSMLYKKKRTSTLAEDIAKYIEKEYKKDITLEALCENFKFSKNHIINIFKKEYDFTPFEYMNILRIRYAERLLERTSDSSEHIATECGFNNYSHFYRQFKEVHGCSPSQWRKKRRISPY